MDDGGCVNIGGVDLAELRYFTSSPSSSSFFSPCFLLAVLPQILTRKTPLILVPNHNWLGT